jgi:hypothetical protein
VDAEPLIDCWAYTNEFLVSEGALLKYAYNLTINSGSSALATKSGTWGTGLGGGLAATLSAGAQTNYFTLTAAPNTQLLLNSPVGAINFAITNSLKVVTDCAATGALLLSSQGGSRGWAYKHASFNPNAALTMRILAKRKVSGNGSYLA